jgi:hypothetical protein
MDEANTERFGVVSFEASDKEFDKVEILWKQKKGWG